MVTLLLVLTLVLAAVAACEMTRGQLRRLLESPPGTGRGPVTRVEHAPAAVD